MTIADIAPTAAGPNHWVTHMKVPPAQGATAASPATDTPLITMGADGKSFFQNVLDVVNPLEHLPVVSTIYHAITGNKSGDIEKVAGDAIYGGLIGLASSVADLAFEKITGKDFGETVMAMAGIGSKDDAPDSGGGTDKTTVLAANADAQVNSDDEVAVTAALNRASLKAARAGTTFALAAMTPPVTPPMAPLVATAAPPITMMAAAAATTASLASATATRAASTAATPASKAASASQTVIDISPQTDALLASLQRNGVTGAMQTQALDAYRRTTTMNAQTVH